MSNNIIKNISKEIQLAERLIKCIENNSCLNRFSACFAEAYVCDSEKPSNVFGPIFHLYINGSHDVRSAINETFISLCGYGINTLLNESESTKYDFVEKD